jgi:hypothetical protein
VRRAPPSEGVKSHRFFFKANYGFARADVGQFWIAPITLDSRDECERHGKVFRPRTYASKRQGGVLSPPAKDLKHPLADRDSLADQPV